MASDDDRTSGETGIPKQFFTVATFGTLGGAAVVTWVVSSVLSHVFRTDVKVVGLIVSVGVAYAGLFLCRDKRREQYVVTFFNGFLIYATVIGGTSLLPYLNEQTAKVVREGSASVKAALTTPWVPDKNLVAATEDLLEIKEAQTEALTDLERQVEEIQSRLEAPEGVGTDEFLERLSGSRTIIHRAESRVTPRVESLKRGGVIPEQR